MSQCLRDAELHHYHARELDQAGETRVREHLAQCEKCARRDAELVAEREELLGRVKGMALSEPEAPPPEDADANAPEGDGPEQDTVSLRRSDWTGSADGDLAVPRELGSVRLIREIGRGGMGVVWLGRDGLLERDVAVKFLPGAAPDEGDPHFEQFLEGARAEASIRHPNIVSVYSAGMAGDLPYLVMDYIDGPSLRQLVKQAAGISVAAAVRTMSDVASAVAVLHGRGILHRDLKPGNVLLDEDGQVLVTDFGLALLRRRSDQSTWAAGTPAYMAPEAFEGKAAPQTDVYAMGMMLFELLGGSIARVGGVSARRARQADEPLPLTDLAGQVPSQLLEVIERATHTQALFRYKTAEHFQRALGESLAAGHLLREVETELKTIVARSITQQPVETPTQPSEETPGSSYFDRLSEIAAKKRRASTRPAKTEAAVPPERVEAPDERRIAHDVPCIGCGYNLRSLSPTANCPECNEALSSSLDSERLIFADPRWLSKVARGSTLFYAATFPLLWPSVLGLPLQVISLVDGASGRPTVFSATFAYISALILGAMTVGVFLSTTPEPHRATTGWGKAARLLALLLCCGAFASIGLVGVEEVIAGVYIVIWPGLVVLTVAALVCHLSAHTRRIPDQKLARRLRVVAAVSSPFCLLCVAAFVLVVTRGESRAGGLTVSVALMPLFVAIGLVWAQVGSYRRAVKLALAQAIPYGELFGPSVRGGPDESGMGGPVGLPGPQVRDPDAAIVRDVPCAACGYNLRSLLPTGNCPECNAAVSSSLDSERLIFADPRWLSKVARGSTLFYAATLPLPWPFLLALPDHVVELMYRKNLGVATVVCVLALILGAMTAGVFLTTAAERHRATTGWGKTARVSVLLLCCGAFASVGLVGVGRVFRGVFAVIWAGLVVLTVAALVLHLSAHARRIPDLKLARRLRVVTVVFIPVCLLCVAAFVLALTRGGARVSYLTAIIVALLVASGLVWTLVGSHRRAVKRALGQVIPYGALLGLAGVPPGTAGNERQL